MKQSSSSVRERLLEVYEYYQRKGVFTHQQDFAAKWGISKTALSNYVVERSEPNNSTWAQFSEIFPEINLDYMITGKGTMLKGKEEYAHFIHGASISTEPLEDYHTNMQVLNTAKELLQGFDQFWGKKEELRSLITAKLQG